MLPELTQMRFSVRDFGSWEDSHTHARTRARTLVEWED